MNPFVTVVKSGNSGQPLAASMLNDDLADLGSRSRTVSVNDVERGVFKRLFVGLRLRKLINQNQNKFFIVHLNVESFILQLSNRKNVIFINHGIYDFGRRLSLLRIINIFIIWISIYIFNNKVYFVSRKQANVFGHYCILPNRINPSGLMPRYARPGDALPITVVGFVGRNDQQKNLVALEGLVSKYPKVIFNHLGPQPIEKFGSYPNYIFMGPTKRKEFFEQSNLLLVPSQWESFGLVAYEANYCGIPVVHSGMDGLKDLPFGLNVGSSERKVWDDLNLNTLTEADFKTAINLDVNEIRNRALSEINNEILSFSHNTSS